MTQPSRTNSSARKRDFDQLDPSSAWVGDEYAVIPPLTWEPYDWTLEDDPASFPKLVPIAPPIREASAKLRRKKRNADSSESTIMIPIEKVATGKIARGNHAQHPGVNNPQPPEITHPQVPEPNSPQLPRENNARLNGINNAPPPAANNGPLPATNNAPLPATNTPFQATNTPFPAANNGPLNGINNPPLPDALPGLQMQFTNAASNGINNPPLPDGLSVSVYRVIPTQLIKLNKIIPRPKQLVSSVFLLLITVIVVFVFAYIAQK